MELTVIDSDSTLVLPKPDTRDHAIRRRTVNAEFSAVAPPEPLAALTVALNKLTETLSKPAPRNVTLWERITKTLTTKTLTTL